MDIRPRRRKGSHSIRRYLFLSRILKGFLLSAKEFNVNLQNLRFIFFFHEMDEIIVAGYRNVDDRSKYKNGGRRSSQTIVKVRRKKT